MPTTKHSVLDWPIRITVCTETGDRTKKTSLRKVLKPPTKIMDPLEVRFAECDRYGETVTFSGVGLYGLDATPEAVAALLRRSGAAAVVFTSLSRPDDYEDGADLIPGTSVVFPTSGERDFSGDGRLDYERLARWGAEACGSPGHFGSFMPTDCFGSPDEGLAIHEGHPMPGWCVLAIEGTPIDDLLGLAPTDTDTEDAFAGLGLDDDITPDRPTDRTASRPIPDGPRFKMSTIADLDTHPGVQWLVNGVLPARSLAVVFAPPDTYKTFLAADAALHIAAGAPCWGQPVQQGAVVYVLGEGRDGMRDRLAAARHYHGIPATVPLLIPECGLNLTRATDVTAFIAAVQDATRGAPVALVVLDTWSRSNPGMSENDNGHTSGAVDECARIQAALGCTVLVVHHGNESGPRGATALAGAADTLLRVERDPRGAVLVHTTKQRHAPKAAPIKLHLVPVLGSLAVEHVPDGAVVGDDAPAPARGSAAPRKRPDRPQPSAKAASAPAASKAGPHIRPMAAGMLTALRDQAGPQGGSVAPDDWFAECVTAGLVTAPAGATCDARSAGRASWFARKSELVKAGLVTANPDGTFTPTTTH